MSLQPEPLFSERDLDNRFDHHPPKDDFIKTRHEIIRDETKKLAKTYVQECLVGRELAVAITKLEEAMFWANAAIARNK